MLNATFLKDIKKRLAVAIEEDEAGEITLDVNELEILLDEIEEQREEIADLARDIAHLETLTDDQELLN